MCGSREHDLPQVAIRAAALDVRSTTACTWIGGDVEAHYLARHPIFDRAGVVVGYELLYRSGDAHNRADVVDDVQATMDVIYRSVVELGLEATVSAVPAWLNVTAEVLRRQAHQVFAPGSVVLEILESVRADDDVLELLDEVAAQGYTIALDDFVCGTGRDELVAHAAVVKLELPAIAPDDLAAQVAEVHRRGATALVEKIETHEQHALARAAGADLFQGYFFTKPQILATRSASPSTPALLALLAKVNDPDVELEDLSRLVTTDVALATKVIQGANSGFAGLRHRVDSVRQAVVLIGLNRMRQLVDAARDGPGHRQARGAVPAGARPRGDGGRPGGSRLGRGAGARGPRPGVHRGPALDRGRVHGPAAARGGPRLGLGDELRDALIDRAGILGRVLAAALAYEDDDVAGHDPASISEVYAAAVRRADERWGSWPSCDGSAGCRTAPGSRGGSGRAEADAPPPDRTLVGVDRLTACTKPSAAGSPSTVRVPQGCGRSPGAPTGPRPPRPGAGRGGRQAGATELRRHRVPDLDGSRSGSGGPVKPPIPATARSTRWTNRCVDQRGSTPSSRVARECSSMPSNSTRPAGTRMPNSRAKASPPCSSARRGPSTRG